MEGGGGKHGNRKYEGFSKEDHEKDVSGNNALIKILEAKVKKIEKAKEKEKKEKEKKEGE